MREIARELGAGTIVEGGVQRVGSRVRLNVQLIDARTDVHRWAERYDRELTADDLEAYLAWAGLGTALIALVDYGHTDSLELVERGRAA